MILVSLRYPQVVTAMNGQLLLSYKPKLSANTSPIQGKSVEDVVPFYTCMVPFQE